MDPRHPKGSPDHPERGNENAYLGGRRIYDPRTGQQNQELEEMARKAQAEAATWMAQYGNGQRNTEEHGAMARRRVQDLLQPSAHAGSSTSHQQQYNASQSFSQNHNRSSLPPQVNARKTHSVEAWRLHAYAHEADATLPSFLNEDPIPQPQPQLPGSSSLDVILYGAEGQVKRKPGRPKGSTTGLGAHQSLSRFSPHSLSRSSSRSTGPEPTASAAVPVAERPSHVAELRAGYNSLDHRSYVAPSISITRSQSPAQAAQPSVYQPPTHHTLRDIRTGPTAESSSPFVQQQTCRYQDRNYHPQAEYHPSSSQLVHPQPRRPNQITRLIAILIDDRRYEGADPLLAEFKLRLYVADEADGYWCNTKDLCEQLQNSPSRIDGPAKVYCFRGKYRQCFLRVSAGNRDNYGSDNLHVQDGRTLQVFVEADNTPTLRHRSTEQQSYDNFDKSYWTPSSRSPSPFSASPSRPPSESGRSSLKRKTESPIPSRSETNLLGLLTVTDSKKTPSSASSPWSSPLTSLASSPATHHSSSEASSKIRMPKHPRRKIRRVESNDSLS